MNGIGTEHGLIASPQLEQPGDISLNLELDEGGARLVVASVSEDSAGNPISEEFILDDTVDIYQYLTAFDPALAERFAQDLKRWDDRHGSTLSALDIELPGRPSGETQVRGEAPLNPMTRAGGVVAPDRPQTVVSTSTDPRRPEDRAAKIMPSRDAGTGAQVDPTDAPRPDFNVVMNQRKAEALRQAVERIDSGGDSSLDLQTRVLQLPTDKRREVDAFLTREWIREEQARLATVVIGRNGDVWTRGQEEADQKREAFENSMEELGAVAGSLGGAALMSAARAKGVTDHQVLMNLGEIGATIESASEIRLARVGFPTRSGPHARRRSGRARKGSKSARGRRGPRISPELFYNRLEPPDYKPKSIATAEFDPKRNQWMLVVDGTNAMRPVTGKNIVYVTMEDGTIRIKRLSTTMVNQGEHHTLAEGKPVQYAGEVQFSKGRVTSWNNKSGHYRPRPEAAAQAGFPMSKFEATQE